MSSVFAPDQTNRANVARFTCELVANPAAWAAWVARMPVIVNAAEPGATTPRSA